MISECMSAMWQKSQTNPNIIYHYESLYSIQTLVLFYQTDQNTAFLRPHNPPNNERTPFPQQEEFIVLVQWDCSKIALANNSNPRLCTLCECGCPLIAMLISGLKIDTRSRGTSGAWWMEAGMVRILLDLICLSFHFISMFLFEFPLRGSHKISPMCWW